MRPHLSLVALAVALFAAAAILPATDAAPTTAIERLNVITVLVEDQEEALAWYTDKLGFVKRVDASYGEGQRWLTVAPRAEGYPEIALEPARGTHREQVGKQPALVFETTDCQGDYERLEARGVSFDGPPQEMPWAIQATLRDLYGNPIVLVQERPDGGSGPSR